MQLSEHFDSREWDCRDGTPCPHEYARAAQKLATKYLESLRGAYGPVHIVSGFRSPKHNVRIGGARQSFHLHQPGRLVAAADIICRRGRPADWYRHLDELGAPGLGLYAVFVHVDNRSYKARW